jgi:hypothetical protein
MRSRPPVVALVLLAALELVGACSDRVSLQTVGGKCEFDEQCATGLVCKCVRRQNPDDEGPDEILAPGTCQAATFTCTNTDAGVAADTAAPPADSGPTDSTAPDTGSLDTGAMDGGAGDSAPFDSATAAADAADAG